jgi:hypothetical protein
MGRSLTVSVSDLPMEVANMERFRAEACDPYARHAGVPVGPLYSKEAMEVRDKVEALVNAYNYDRSDSMTDYFDWAFASNVDLDCSFEEARKRAEAELAAEEATTEANSHEDWLLS